jgi:hypothetical protein
MSAEEEPVHQAAIGSSDWTAAFMDAANQAISEAVEAHLKAGNPVYFTDDEGNICEVSPDRKIRKLTSEEVDQLISEAASS